MNRTILVILFLVISLSVSVFSQDSEIDYSGWSEKANKKSITKHKLFIK